MSKMLLLKKYFPRNMSLQLFFLFAMTFMVFLGDPKINIGWEIGSFYFHYIPEAFGSYFLGKWFGAILQERKHLILLGALVTVVSTPWYVGFLLHWNSIVTVCFVSLFNILAIVGCCKESRKRFY